MKIKATNKRLFRIIQVMIIIGTLVSANVLFTMVTKTHIWTGHNVLDSRISNSIVHTTVSAKRGEILDRNGTVIAQDTTAYTVIAYVDSSNVDANGKANYVKHPKQVAKKLKTVLTDIDVDQVADTIQNAKDKGLSQTELGAGTKRISKSKMKKNQKVKISWY